MLHKFGSNLSFKSDGNSINMVNSARRLSYTAGDLLLASRRVRGRLWRRAGVEKAAAWLPLASWPSFIAWLSPFVSFSPPLCFPDAAAMAAVPVSVAATSS